MSDDLDLELGGTRVTEAAVPDGGLDVKFAKDGVEYKLDALGFDLRGASVSELVGDEVGSAKVGADGTFRATFPLRRGARGVSGSSAGLEPKRPD